MRAEYVAEAGLSDHSSFLAHGINAVSLSTGNHSDYHKVSDIASRVNGAGIDRVVDVAEAILRRSTDR